MKGVDKHVDCTSKTCAVIGRFPIARTVSGYENQILIGYIWERNVVRKKAAVCGEECCVTSLKTAAKETNCICYGLNLLKVQLFFLNQLNFFKLVHIFRTKLDHIFQTGPPYFPHYCKTPMNLKNYINKVIVVVVVVTCKT